jgi:hypothetical protein
VAEEGAVRPLRTNLQYKRVQPSWGGTLGHRSAAYPLARTPFEYPSAALANRSSTSLSSIVVARSDNIIRDMIVSVATHSFEAPSPTMGYKNTTSSSRRMNPTRSLRNHLILDPRHHWGRFLEGILNSCRARSPLTEPAKIVTANHLEWDQGQMNEEVT